MKPFILVVDDAEHRRHALISNLETEGYRVVAVAEPERACALLAKQRPDLLLLNEQLADEGTPRVLACRRETRPGLPVIQLTSWRADTEPRPGEKGESLFGQGISLALDGLLARVAQELQEVDRPQGASCEVFGQLEDVVPSRSGQMQELCETIRKISASDATTVLIEGESGAGKDVVARIIHKTSSRRDFPFLEINCAALPENLLESELFGHEKGAFTDAVAQKLGLLELAHSGTIFLDEIGEMSPPVQVKLLQVLEKMTFRRVGGIKDIAVDVRILGATNRNLADQVRAGSFREDLYYRLQVIQLRVPPLRARREDILPLARYFLDMFSRKFRKGFEVIAPEAEQVLVDYGWPGNIRELKNLMEKTVLLEDAPVLGPEHLRLPSAGDRNGDLSRRLADVLDCPWPADGIRFEHVVQDLERALIDRALTQAGGNQSRAARLLHLNRDKLRYRLKQFPPKE